MIGIRDTTGATVGFVGRDLSGAPNAPRYLNTGETPVYKKGDHLLGLYEAPPGASLYRVEGPFDAIAITAAGDGHAAGIAPLGTALSNTQADTLAAASGGRVWEALDNDPAGRHATAKDFWALTDRGVDVRGVHLPGSDPAEIWQRDPDQLRRVLAAEDTWPSAAETVIDDLIDRDRDRLATSEPDAVQTYRAKSTRSPHASPSRNAQPRTPTRTPHSPAPEPPSRTSQHIPPMRRRKRLRPIPRTSPAHLPPRLRHRPDPRP